MKLLHVLAVSAAFAAPMASANTMMIKDVVVETDMSAIGNEAAAKYWGNLATDLQAAILSRVQDRIKDDGVTVGVDINEVSLANSFQTTLGVADSVLVGVIRITNAEGTQLDTYELSVSIEIANRYLKDGVAPASSFTDSPEHYAAMVDAFAESVVERLK